MALKIKDISCTIAPEALSNLLESNQVVRFMETGCVVGRSRREGFVGVGPYDLIDLLIDKGTSYAEVATQVLQWATSWADDLRVRCPSRR